MDPHHFEKLDPDPHQSGKLDPDPDLHQSEKVKAIDGHIGACLFIISYMLVDQYNLCIKRPYRIELGQGETPPNISFICWQKELSHLQAAY
jgi:hypothetical protein